MKRKIVFNMTEEKIIGKLFVQFVFHFVSIRHAIKYFF